MVNFESDTKELIAYLPLTDEQREQLIQAVEWEKELSWSNGYADACEQNGID